MRLLLTGDDQYSHWRRSVFLQPAIGVLTTPHKGYKVQEWLFRESPKAVFGDEDRLLQLARQASVGDKTGSFSWQNNHLYETGASLDRRQRNYCIPAVRLLLTKTNVTKGPFTVFTIHSLIFVPLPEKTCAGSVSIYYYI